MYILVTNNFQNCIVNNSFIASSFCIFFYFYILWSSSLLFSLVHFVLKHTICTQNTIVWLPDNTIFHKLLNTPIKSDLLAVVDLYSAHATLAHSTLQLEMD